MPKPVSPIIPGHSLPEVVFAKNQPQYQPLPAWRDVDGTLLTRWRLTWRERLMVLLRGDIYLWIMTFNRTLQPVKIQVEKPEFREPAEER